MCSHRYTYVESLCCRDRAQRLVAAVSEIDGDVTNICGGADADRECCRQSGRYLRRRARDRQTGPRIQADGDVCGLPATLAVTFAVRGALSEVVATPFESVVAVGGFTVPLSVVNVTGIPDRPVPDTSSTRAEIVDIPPPGGSVCGFALTITRSTPAAPTFRFSSFPDAPPENAVIVAMPL